MVATICGVDPGLSGAIAVLDESGKILELMDIPIIQAKKRELDEIGIRDAIEGNSHVFIEKVGAMPGQGIVSTGRFLTVWGIIRGICVGLKLPYTLVHPKTWKKGMMEGMDKSEKGASIVRAKQLFPKVDLPLKKDHHKADALLIAEYGRRSLNTYRTS